jgi:hypothetical protein
MKEQHGHDVHEVNRRMKLDRTFHMLAFTVGYSALLAACPCCPARVFGIVFAEKR